MYVEPRKGSPQDVSVLIFPISYILLMLVQFKSTFIILTYELRPPGK